ncbi:DUF1361 domain-containing protein [Paramaledivibacter caminithermalis]|jgi:uncharacterized membrane protein|uniref:Uncharacterized membrane protein n=1 Tax=Paramaledivibacter caminithermalis (strain DSM 15212 / CIP 107654 / DViRD3) TaxID=1121301 RepID=A0A1M6NZL9_PARC5|nr:DUF1361 domain-containing protein [Paramaledivibacter caminithermalis]SHK01167.1 Uncharacterized membrane protein [Paramaledivibacter caminithermalis DSM 15212]
MTRERKIKLSLSPIIKVLGALSIIGFIMIAFRILNQKSIRFAFLIWNLFLAWIPLLLSLAMNYIDRIQKYSTKKTIYLLALGFCWLIFFPNAPYIVTDIIHLSNYNYYSIYNDAYSFSSSFIMWYDFILVMLFVFTGYILGHISLYSVHKIIEEKSTKVMGWIFVFVVSILSGFAIYLGRFLRLNSWEIISSPVNLFKRILESINILSMKFTFMFGFFIFLMYIAIYNLSFLEKE